MFVKVCGLSTPESVRTAAEAGADAVGFVLTRSPREVTPAQARELLAHVPAGLPAVGVFRHEAAADAVELAREAGLDWVQLHGDRTPDDVRTVHDAGFKLIRAVTMSAAPDAFADWGEDLLLIDAAVPGLRRGLGLRLGPRQGAGGAQVAAGRRARSRQRRRRRVAGGRVGRGRLLRRRVLPRGQGPGQDPELRGGGQVPGAEALNRSLNPALARLAAFHSCRKTVDIPRVAARESEM